MDSRKALPEKLMNSKQRSQNLVIIPPNLIKILQIWDKSFHYQWENNFCNAWNLNTFTTSVFHNYIIKQTQDTVRDNFDWQLDELKIVMERKLWTYLWGTI